MEPGNLELGPCVVRADRTATLVAARPGVTPPWRLSVTGVSSGARATCTMAGPGRGALGATGGSCLLRSDGVIELTHLFPGEQEHVIGLDRVEGDAVTRLARGAVYSLDEDLFSLRPFKGDFHLHSNASDGVEPPAQVAAHCRRIGLDFMALTDHQEYQSSLDAIAAFAGVKTDLQMFPGEEVHPPGSTVHVVNFGGRHGLTPCFADAKAFQAAMARRASALGGLPAGVDAHMVASSEWCFEQIRAAGGLAVFCHPYWIHGSRFDAPEPVTSHLFSTRSFDALEVIGGYHVHEAEANALQVARWADERRKGDLPIVGASDAHGCETGALFGWYYTIVFVPRPGLADIVEAVKACRAVAIEARPGEQPRIYGPFRLVSFAYFLMRAVMPRHDALCREEGMLMLAHVAGDRTAAAKLAARAVSVQAFIEQCWGTAVQ